ncbi:MAG: hypothetical protein MUC49_19490 [Raineya sp.]|jgi:hypothetical protein|nr:hypothetical protein [Raineya sp.]
MADLLAYLQNGAFTVFAPGVDASIELGKTSTKMDKFLASKDNAPNFCFISYDIFDDNMSYTDAESERAFLDRNEDSSMKLLTDASNQEWRYYMAGFRHNAFDIGSLGGIIIVNVDFEKVKNFLAQGKDTTWLVYGKKGEKAELFNL